MKNHATRFTFALIALCSALNLTASPSIQSIRLPGEIPIPEVTALFPVNGDTVNLGTSRIMASMRLGTPSGVLADGSWLYSGYEVRLSAASPALPGTLVVRFTSNQVSSLSVADKTTVVALQSAPKPRAKDHLLAANDRR